MTNNIVDEIRDNSPSETQVLRDVANAKPHGPTASGTTIEIVCSSKAHQAIKPVVHGIGVVIHWPNEGITQGFSSGSDRSSDKGDSWADRAAFGAALGALVWIEKHAPEASVTIYTGAYQNVVTDGWQRIEALPSDAARKGAISVSKQKDQLQKLCELKSHLSHVRWDDAKKHARIKQRLAQANELADTGRNDARSRMNARIAYKSHQ